MLSDLISLSLCLTRPPPEKKRASESLFECEGLAHFDAIARCILVISNNIGSFVKGLDNVHCELTSRGLQLHDERCLLCEPIVHFRLVNHCPADACEWPITPSMVGERTQLRLGHVP